MDSCEQYANCKKLLRCNTDKGFNKKKVLFLVPFKLPNLDLNRFNKVFIFNDLKHYLANKKPIPYLFRISNHSPPTPTQRIEP